ncbi:MAG: hypothetical protein H8E90_02045 [Anaerolineales bacterium]|nr:hypothetical protein [Anaerolineales bacterium]
MRDDVASLEAELQSVQGDLAKISTPVPENVAVVTELGEGLPPLMADPDQIEQVFINMISNAVQAMTSSSPVETPAATICAEVSLYSKGKDQ